jgi:hypothetical protein
MTFQPAPLPADKAQPIVTPTPAAPGEKLHEGLSVRTLPAPPGLTAAVSLRVALANPDVAEFRDAGLAPGSPVAELRLVTNGDQGANVEHPVTKRLAWVLTYHNSTPIPLHGRSASKSAPVPVSCDFTIIIDATTGSTIKTFQECHPA